MTHLPAVFRFLKVLRHRYTLVYESKVFFLSSASNTSLLQILNLLLVVILQQINQKVFSLRINDGAHDAHDIALNFDDEK